MLWTTAVGILCVIIASACFLWGDEAEKRARLANVAAVTFVGVGIVVFFAGIFSNL